MIFALLLFLASLMQRALHFKRFAQQPALLIRRRLRRKPGHSQAKPEWVQQEILRLKVLMPQGTGVRKIAAAFNRKQVKRITVSKTHVANVLRRNECALLMLRRDIRSHISGVSGINQVWGMDLSGKIDQAGQLHHILGIIDHGSRRLLSLIATGKQSALLVAHIQKAVSEYGQPRRIRTDNEPCFTSPVFSQSLQSRGIRHQRIAMHCPWQNGRIERLFGTLKQQLNQIQIQSAEHLQSLLDEFKHWYNTIRLHQHLGYLTPREVWQQQKLPYSKKLNKNSQIEQIWWTGWSGLLSGVQWQC